MTPSPHNQPVRQTGAASLEHATPEGEPARSEDVMSEELEEVARIAPVAAVLESFARIEFELRTRLEAQVEPTQIGCRAIDWRRALSREG